MQINTFEEFYEDVCQSLGETAEPMGYDETGCSFAVQFDGLQVTVLHSPPRGPDYALVMVNLGVPEPQHKQAALIELMEANFALMAQEPAPVGCIHALTGELFLQYASPLDGSSGEEFLVRIEAIAAWSARWDRLSGRRVAAAGTAARVSMVTDSMR